MSNNGLTKEQIIDALRPVKDPEIGRSLVDLGMIKDVDIDNHNVTVHVELTTPACPLREDIKNDVTVAVKGVNGVQDVDLKFTARVRPSGAGMTNRQQIHGVKNVIAVASGKGGVGKSTVAVNMAIALAQDGASVGLLDADVYGPSIPMMMGIQAQPMMRDNKIVPLDVYGVKIMSIGFLIEPSKALIWRGPLVSQLVTQFLKDVDWGELDYLVVDLPPGTGDAQLTLVQQIPLSGAVIVTTPQNVALADAVKGLAMFREVKTHHPGHRREHELLHLPELRRRDGHLWQRRRRSTSRMSTRCRCWHAFRSNRRFAQAETPDSRSSCRILLAARRGIPPRSTPGSRAIGGRRHQEAAPRAHHAAPDLILTKFEFGPGGVHHLPVFVSSRIRMSPQHFRPRR